MTNDIFFSVMICCYNSEKYLCETIDSVINQTHTNWEIIAVNDGSTDGTDKIILHYLEKKIPIKYHEQKNKGFANARNKAIELAQGDWIAIIDHDDICLPNRLEIQAKHILKNPNAKLFFANTIHFKDEENEIKRQFDHFNPCGLDLTAGKAMNSMLRKGFIDTESVVFEKQAALSVGGFDTSYKYIVDHDFFLRMGSKYDFFAGDEVISKWRVHQGQATQRMDNVIFKEDNQIFCKYFRFKGVTNRTRFIMMLNQAKYYVTLCLIKLKLRV